MATLPPQEDDCTIQFVCPSCTYINRRYDKMCEMCMVDRPIPDNIDTLMTTIEQRLRQIDTMVIANNELIEQVNAQNENINLITYVITRQADGKHTVAEQTTTSPAQTIVAQWKGSVELNQVPDVFNDKISFQCDNFQDLVRLNRDMSIVAHKYELFGDGPRAINEINKFESNYRRIQTALRLILELINTGGRGHLADIEEQLQCINSFVAELQNKYKNLRFT